VRFYALDASEALTDAINLNVAPDVGFANP